MDNWKAIQVLEYTKNYDGCDYGAPRIAIDKGISALEFELRARELLKAAVDLLGKQKESNYVLNLLEETVYYDDAECDGYCLMEDICHLLIEVK